MLKDTIRMDAYRNAMSSAIKPGDIVLDVGTGTGVLALMAISLGASKVYAIDKSDIIDYAIQVKNQNAPEADIEFIKADIFDVDLGEIKADIVICELFGNFGIDENVIDVLAHVRSSFLKPDGILIPESMSLVVAPVQCTDAFKDIAFWQSSEFDYNFKPMQELAFNAVYQFLGEPVKLLSNPQTLQVIDFHTVKTNTDTHNAKMTVNRAGVIHGIAGWFKTSLYKNIEIDCSPIKEPTHWGQILFPIGNPKKVAPSTEVHFAFNEVADRRKSTWRWSGTINTAESLKQYNYCATREFS